MCMHSLSPESHNGPGRGQEPQPGQAGSVLMDTYNHEVKTDAWRSAVLTDLIQCCSNPGPSHPVTMNCESP
jgi:hypothetical protein